MKSKKSPTSKVFIDYEDISIRNRLTMALLYGRL